MHSTTSGERGAAYERPLTVTTKAPSILGMRHLHIAADADAFLDRLEAAAA